MGKALTTGNIGRRDTSRDGLINRLEYCFTSNLRPFWCLVNRIPPLSRFFNYVLINRLVSMAPARPLPLSTLSPYTSWQSLSDRTYFGRYLPPRKADPPIDIDQVAKLFEIGSEGPTLSDRSTLLFPVFAQWFTDGWLQTRPGPRRIRTYSKHQIDLNPLYGLEPDGLEPDGLKPDGLKPDVTRALRRMSEIRGERGRMKSEIIDREEWAPRLYDADGGKKPEFMGVPDPFGVKASPNPATLFAFGSDRANATAYTAMMNTLFLREHNRLCQMLEAAHPRWDDEQVFQTARNINIALLMKIVVEVYINHISSAWLRFRFNPKIGYHADWNRPNWIPIEFNLLYRWHSLVPKTVDWNGKVKMESLRLDNTRLLRDGLGCALDSASSTPAWKLGLFNTPDFLFEVEKASIQQGRDNELATYNEYREAVKFPRVTRFEQINGDPRVVDALRRVYGHVDKIEYFVGIFAEETPSRLGVTPIIMRMVAVDAFSHLLTNPLLAPLVYNAATFSAEGLETIQNTRTLKDLLERNIPHSSGSYRATMELNGAEVVA
jgi:prostaglandin-endoperoxide synthase 2